MNRGVGIQRPIHPYHIIEIDEIEFGIRAQLKIGLLENHQKPLYKRCILSYQLCFPSSFFKIRLIRLDFLSKKQKIPVLELTTDIFSVRSHNHYTKEPTVSGRHRKAFKSLQSCSTGSR